MKKLNCIFLLIIVPFIINGKTIVDASKYQIQVDDSLLVKRFNDCISLIHKWNDDNKIGNGIITIKPSVSERNEYCFILSEIRPLDTRPIDELMPDNLSYFGEQLVFWYFGKSGVTTQRDQNKYASMCEAYSKYLGIRIVSPKTAMPKNSNSNTLMEVPSKIPKNIPRTLSKEEMLKLKMVKVGSANDVTERLPPTFFLKKRSNQIEVTVLYEISESVLNSDNTLF